VNTGSSMGHIAAAKLRLWLGRILTPGLPRLHSIPRPDYGIADQHALSCPDAHTRSVGSLGRYLGEPFATPVMRARSIFRWVTANIDYDTEAIRAGRPTPYSPRETLRRRLGVCQHFAELFTALADVAGLRAQVVVGDARIGGQMPELANDDCGHAWNVVCLAGYWRLLDATWGSGALDSNLCFRRNFSPYYFLTPPERLLYTHFPRDPSWQLVRTPLSRPAFETRPVLGGQFFAYGLELQEPNARHVVTRGPVRVRIKAPPSVWMMARVEKRGRNVECPGLSDWNGNGDLLFHVGHRGTYTLMLYARRNRPGLGINHYDGVLNLTVECP
jgi:transglutaminase/protease-like cytokinesis protein 3